MFAGGDSHKMIWVMAKLTLRDNNIVKSVFCVQLSLRKKHAKTSVFLRNISWWNSFCFSWVTQPRWRNHPHFILRSFFFSWILGHNNHGDINFLKQWNSMKFPNFQFNISLDAAMPRLFRVFGHAHALTERAGGCDSHRPSMVPLDFITWFLRCLKLRWGD